MGVLAVATALATGCVVHRGPNWQRRAEPAVPNDRPTSGPAFSLVVIGNPGAPGRHAQQVATGLRSVLAAERAAGHAATVLWLGDLVMAEHPDRRDACPDPTGAWAREGSHALADTVREHVAAGGQSFAVLGPGDRRCGLDQVLHQTTTTGPNPWLMPDDHYVLRVGADGRTQVVSTCADGGCTVSPADADAVLDLVVVDATVWTGPPAAGDALVRSQASARRLDELVTAAVRSDGPPRVLVGAVPIEAAGVHGHGGLRSEATFHNLPPRLAEAIVQGRFIGSIGAYDRALYATADITDAIKRSDKTWVAAPLFQLVSGAASWPDARAAAGRRRLEYFRGNAYRPPIYSDHGGFAVVRGQADALHLELWARRRGHWETQPLAVPLHPARHPAETASPPMAPCLRCPETPADHR
jgi:hypothetical protein